MAGQRAPCPAPSLFPPGGGAVWPIAVVPSLPHELALPSSMASLASASPFLGIFRKLEGERGYARLTRCTDCVQVIIPHTARVLRAFAVETETE